MIIRNNLYPNNLKVARGHKKVMNKKAFQMSFAWLFAIIVGGFILFLTIYGATKLMDSGQQEQAAKTGKEIEVLLNPIETGFESGKSSSIYIPIESRIYNKCDNSGEFGTQYIEVSQKNRKKWIQTDLTAGTPNKYLFSNNYVEGKTFYLFSKPFRFPFKVADVIYMTSSLEEYCFLNPNEDIVKEILDLDQPNIKLGGCQENTINVCFAGGDNCDINVNYYSKYVEKEGVQMYFETDALMYAAIFSDKQVYECHLKRLLQRLENLAELYRTKESFLASQGSCSIEVTSDLIQLGTLANSIQSSETLFQLNNIVESTEISNDRATCSLW